MNHGPREPALAEAGNAGLRVEFRAAPPLTLHGRTCWRTDGNSPLRIGRDGATVFFSHYEPLGHTLRRLGRRDLTFDQPPVPVTLQDDPDPGVGKWIEAIWQQPDGPLHGWYHGEEPVVGAPKLNLAHVGHVVSHDEGLTWRCCGEVLRLPPDMADRSWRNGFLAGGYGDLSALADRDGRWLYVFFSSYHPDEAAQGVAVLRLPATDPAASPALWTGQGWCTDRRVPPQPIWPTPRSWRHADPIGFWGPAVHYNRALGAFVMLLNRTAGGAGDLLQEGIYASVNRNLDDVQGWSPPLRIVRGGAWYPQAVGLEDGCGDTEVGRVGRFYMAGFSAWQIGFSNAGSASSARRPLTCTVEEFARLFGADRRCPW